ncbi:MAG: pilin [Patescibacteria group bacterium]
MSKTLKRILGFGTLALIFSAFLTPVTFAQGVECDSDADGFISFPASGTDVILGEGVNINGNYSAAEWANFFETFKNDPAAESLCSALNFKKGAEPTRCDKSLISPTSGVFDPSQVDSVQGNAVFPTAFDKPANGIDENCDGADGKLIEGGETGTNLGSLADRVVYMLSRAVVVISVIVLIWGGILYSTAAGDERKTSKARKAIIGAIIGLAVGLLAPSVANFIIASLA